MTNWSARQDSNLRPPASKAGRLARLTYSQLLWGPVQDSNPYPRGRNPVLCSVELTGRNLVLLLGYDPRSPAYKAGATAIELQEVVSLSYWCPRQDSNLQLTV
jgi:hypothetical protein